MSFSQDVKKELEEHENKRRHCQIAELAALMSYEGKICQIDHRTAFVLTTENEYALRKYFTLLGKTISIDRCDKEIYDEQAKALLEMVKMWKETPQGIICQMETVDGLIVQQECCKRAFLRGAFLATGSISDPNKAYHLEIVCKSAKQATQLQQIMKSFDIEAKMVERKNHDVVYLKEGSQIVDMLNVIGAHISLMKFENIRILKEMRNSVNRKVNCETANISKTVNAAVRQLEDIQFIEKMQGLSSLPENLQEIARIRLENPDAPLKDLGTLLDPPVGKSGVNHRLRRISEIAEKLRQ